MRDVVPIVTKWLRDGHTAVVATVTRTRRSSPRLPGSAMALRDDGVVAGSVTGGCVEPDVIARAERILAGANAELARYGIADADAFEVGLPCGGEVEVMIQRADPEVIEALDGALAAEEPIAFTTVIAGEDLGRQATVRPGDEDDLLGGAAAPLLARGDTDIVNVGETQVLVHSLAPRPAMYVFGAIDFASALAELGHFLGYRVTVCDPRSAFVTPERFRAADELVTEWPHDFLAHAPVDVRSAICVLTHDEKFDVPALKAALATPAGYIGAMGSSRTTARREERLREEGVGEELLERIHAPIGLPIGSKTPEEVAVAIGAQIIDATRTARHLPHETSARV